MFPTSLAKLLLFLVSFCEAKCHGTANSLPFVTQSPVLVSSVSNAKLFKVTNVVPNVMIAHVWGKGKERGLAYGTLLKPYLRTVYDSFIAWADENIDSAIDPYVPKVSMLLRRHVLRMIFYFILFYFVLKQDIAELIAIYGLRAVLELQFLVMRPYMSEEFLEEMEGVAEGSGLSHSEVVHMVVFPDLVKAHCSMIGAWGSATTSQVSTKRLKKKKRTCLKIFLLQFSDSLVQLRALDWATNSPLQQWPLVTVYHTSPNAAFSTLGWPLFIGALTGMSSSPIGVCEKVFLSYNGTDRRNGIPFTLLLRDILEKDTSVSAALERMERAKRTCSIWIGVGSPTSPEKFTVVEYSKDYVRSFNDSDLETGNPAHPQLQDVVYVDKHVQPSRLKEKKISLVLIFFFFFRSDTCMGASLSALHGQIDPRALIMVASLQETGDTHAAVYDFKNMVMLISNASPFVNGTFVPAYNRPFVQLDMQSLFSMQQ